MTENPQESGLYVSTTNSDGWLINLSVNWLLQLVSTHDFKTSWILFLADFGLNIPMQASPPKLEICTKHSQAWKL